MAAEHLRIHGFQPARPTERIWHSMTVRPTGAECGRAIMREPVAPSPPSGRLSVARRITAWRQLLAWLAARPDELTTAKPIKRIHRTQWLYFAAVVAFALATLFSVWWNSTGFDWMWFWGAV